MKNPTYTGLTALLLLMTIPVSAEDKGVERAKGDLKVVIVGGQVTRPGVIEYRNTTIYSMILAAGGPTEFGTLKRVKVFRGGKCNQLDLTNIKIRNKELAMPEDTIEVPQSNPFERDPQKKRG